MIDSTRAPLGWQRFSAPIVALALGACATTPAAPAPSPNSPNSPNSLTGNAPANPPADLPRTGEEPDETVASYPFTRDQLRTAFVVGTRIDLRIEDHGKIHFESLDVTAADQTGCTIATRLVTEQGDLIADKGSQTRTWAEIQADESHPRAETVVTEGKLKTFIGDTDTWLYVYTTTDPEGHHVESYHHYAKKLPGPPVLETDTVDGQLVKRTFMVGRR